MIRLKNVTKSYPAKAEENGGVIRALDNISHGRLSVGFGRAFLPDEFEAFEISMDESRQRFTDGVEACRLLWSEEDVEWKGAFHRFGPVTASAQKRLASSSSNSTWFRISQRSKTSCLRNTSTA